MEVISELNDIFSSGGSFVDSISRAIEALGILLLVIVLVVGFIFFMPTLISSLRNIKLKVLVIIVNVALIITVPINFIIPIVGWLILMIMASAGNEKI